MDLKEHIRESFLADEQKFRHHMEHEREHIRQDPKQWFDDNHGGGSPITFWINPYQGYDNAVIIFNLFGAEPPTRAQYQVGEIWIPMLEDAENAFAAALTEMMAIPGVRFDIGGTEGDGSDYCLWVMVDWTVGSLGEMRQLTDTLDGYHLIQHKDGQDWEWVVTEENGMVSLTYEVRFGDPVDPYDHWTYPTWDAFVAEQTRDRSFFFSRDDWMAIAA